MLGERVACEFAPFFWSMHYDVPILYVGHAGRWDDVRIDGSLTNRDCAASFRVGGKTLALATIGRDRQCLRAELALEHEDDKALAELGR
jgi:hypothetical protein